MLCALLGSTTVLLEDSITVSVADSIFHKTFCVVFLCYQFLLHQSSHMIFCSPVKLRLYNSKKDFRIEELDRALFE